MGSAGGQFLHIGPLTLLSSLHSLLQGCRMSALIISKGALWGRVSERCEMRWKRVQRAKYKHRSNAHTHMHALAKTHTLKKMHKQGCYLNRQQKRKKATHMTKQGGQKGLRNAAKRHRSHLSIHTNSGVADDHQRSLWLTGKTPAKRVKMDVALIWTVPWCQCSDF